MVDIAIVHGSDALATAIASALEAQGWSTATASVHDFGPGRRNPASFLDHHNPRVVVWEILHPYEAHWRDFQCVYQSPAGRRRGYVFAATDPVALSEVAGKIRTVELMGEPFELRELYLAVRRAWSLCEPGTMNIVDQ